MEPPGRPSDAADLHQEPLQGAQRAAIAAVADPRVQGLAVGKAVVVAGLQVALERAEPAGAAAGVRADELLGCWCAGVLAGGAAAHAQAPHDRGNVTPSASRACPAAWRLRVRRRGVPAALAMGDAAVGLVGQLGWRRLQAAAVPGDHLVHRFRQVVHQVPPVGDLDGVRGAAGRWR